MKYDALYVSQALHLWYQNEGRGSATALALSKWRKLTAEERDYFGDKVRTDELRHRLLIKSVAESWPYYVGTQEPHFDNFMFLANMPTRLLRLCRGERMLLYNIHKLKSVLSYVGIDPSFVDVVISDEIGHVEAGFRAVIRLRNDGVIFPLQVLPRTNKNLPRYAKQIGIIQ